MPIVLKEKTGPQVPPGTHIAVCYRIVDVGTQPDTGFGEREKIVLFWELPHERVQVDGKEVPMGISKFYTKSLNKKATLRKDLAAWRGRDFTKEELEGFELKAILGKPCQVAVIANDDGKSVVDAVVAIPKGTQVPNAWNPLVEYSIHDGKTPVYTALPQWVRETCDKCVEWNGGTQEPETHPEHPAQDSDVPF